MKRTKKSKSKPVEPVTVFSVRGSRRNSFDAAAGYAVALAVASGERECIERIVNDQVVERIDIAAALSIDTLTPAPF